MKLAVAGGGTGGHLFPGLAVAELAREDGFEVLFFGAERGLESRVVPAAGFELSADPVEGVVGRNPLAAARAVFGLLAAAIRVRRVCRLRGIDAMIGLGGYASAPGVLGAWLAGVPVVLLEQNRKPGLSNRLLARLARVVCTSFEAGESGFAGSEVRFTGNPLRRGLDEALPYAGRDTLLVFGGSAGARAINRAVPEVLGRLAASFELPPVLHQAGRTAVEEVEAAYRAAGVDADVVPFIDDMAGAYARARLVVCRAGATSVAELVATGTPAVLIPFPFAAADHQTANARELELVGAARVVVEGDRCVQNLEAELSGLLAPQGPLTSMAERAKGLGRPGAVRRVLDAVTSVVATAS